MASETKDIEKNMRQFTNMIKNIVTNSPVTTKQRLLAE